MSILVKDDDVRSGTKANARHGRSRPADAVKYCAKAFKKMFPENSVEMIFII